MGPFIGKLLIQRLVTSNPSPGYIARVASAFNNNGQGDLFVIDRLAVNPGYVVSVAPGQSIQNLDFGNQRSLMLMNRVTAVNEDADTSARIKIADIIVADTLGAASLQLVGPDAGMFEIDNGAIYLRAGVELDSEANPALDATLLAEGALGDAQVEFTVQVVNVNDPPQIILQNPVTALPEDTDTTGCVRVADIFIQDDGLGSNGVSLSGEDADKFELGPDGLLCLKPGVQLDYEADPQLELDVQVDDPSVGSSPDDSQLAIETEGLNLWYGDFQALFDVDLQIKQGHITSLIGPSGCGKTTLLRSVNRIVERLGYVRTSGQVRVLPGHL